MAKVQQHTFPPPTRGFLASTNILTPPEDAAAVLDNWYPTATGTRLRAGSALHATLGDDVVRLFTYRSGSNSTLIGTTETKVYDITSPASTTSEPTAALSSQSSGDWSATQISTSGGDYLVAVNGADAGFYYDGSSFTAYSGGGTNIEDAGTTVDSTDMTQVAQHKSRLWFVQGGTMNAWYLPVDQIGGTLVKFPLGSVFRKGGALLFTSAWSLDSGDGLDDKWVAVSTEGEVAVYGGTNPASATTWALEGVYQVGRPLNKHAFERIGGDLLIFCEEGIIPISAAIQQGPETLMRYAVTFPIEEEWRDQITRRARSRPPCWTIWDQNGTLYVGTEGTATGGRISLVQNVRTGAWCRYVGWNMTCVVGLEAQLFFGSVGGQVYEAEVGGTDEGTAYRGMYVPGFNLCGTPTIKHANHVSVVARGTAAFDFGATCYTDYIVGTPPQAPVLPSAVGGSVFGTATFGTAVWGGEAVRVSSQLWKTVRGRGFSLAPGIAVSSNTAAAPTLELIATNLLFEAGAPL